MRWFFVVSLCLVSIGCGGGDEGFSGVDVTKRLGDLSAAEMRDVCTWVIAQQGGEGAVHQCENGDTVTLDTVDECVAERDGFDTCSVTVRQLEECVLAVGEDVCLAPSTPVCQPLGECDFSP